MWRLTHRLRQQARPHFIVKEAASVAARRDQHRRQCSSIRDTDTRKPMLPARDSRHHLQTNARPAVKGILRQVSRPFAHGKEQR